MKESDLKAVVERVNAAEAHGDIAAGEEAETPTAVIPSECLPSPGEIAARREWAEFKATELTLHNGMRVELLVEMWYRQSLSKFPATRGISGS